ncbi:facilitated trehalose transporter Tret1-like isoform X2 [Lycorma delicatula]
MSGSGGYSHMVEEDEEAISNRNEGAKYRQYQAAILAGLAATAVGTGDGWLMTAIIQKKEGQLNDNNMKLFSYIMNFSALLGALASGYLVDKIGRKQTLILGGITIMPTWILYLFSHRILISLSIGTALGGFASGVVSVAVPLYIAEVTEISVRGILSIFFYLQFVAGELFTSVEGKDINLNEIAVNCILVAVIFLVTFIWMPETPYSLLAKGEENEAKDSIKFFRGSLYQSEGEIESLKQSVSKQTTLKGILKEEKPCNAIIASLLLMLLSRMAAFDGFNFRLYKYVFHEEETMHGRIASFFLLMQMIGIAGAAFFIDRLGRRLLLIISASLMAICISSFVLLESIFGVTSKTVEISFITFYIGSFSFGVGPVPWVIMNELVPHQHKAVSITATVSFFWFMCLTATIRNIAVFSYEIIPAFIYYILVCIGIITLTVFIIPETKGKDSDTITVMNIKNIFSRNKTNIINY